MPYASTADYNVQIVDNSGVPIVTFGGGTQYADGTAAATPTGTQVNFNEGGTQRSVSLTKPLPVQGILGNNAAAPGTTNVGALSGLANAADPAWTEGRQVFASMTLAGYQRTVVQGSVAAGGTPANPISMGFLGTGTTLRNLTAANSVTATSGNDIPGVGLMINDPVTGGGNGTWSRMRDANSADNSGGTGVLGAGLLGWDGSAWRRGSVNTSGQLILASTPAEDAAHASGDRGSLQLTVRNDANASTGLAGTDLDYQALNSNVRGDLYVVAGNHGIAIPTCTFTRGANTIAYTIGDEVGTASTAPTTATCARINGGSGIVYGATVIYSNAPTVTPSLVLGVFNATVTLAGDNAQLNLSDADHAKLVCWIPLTASQDGVYSAGVRSTSGSLALSGTPAGGVPAHYVCGASEKTLYFFLITLNAFTPIANGETLTCAIHLETN